MASSSHLFDNSSMPETVSCVPNPSPSIHEHVEKYPINVFLESISQGPQGGEEILKLPDGWMKNIFGVDDVPKEKILRSDPLNFILPEGMINLIFRRNKVLNMFQLSERLEGWEMEIRPRRNSDQYDRNFCHNMSTRKLRSLAEVLIFFMHGPDQGNKKRKDKETTLNLESLNALTKSKKRKIEKMVAEDNLTSANVSSCEAAQMIEEYLSQEDYNASILLADEHRGPIGNEGEEAKTKTKASHDNTLTEGLSISEIFRAVLDDFDVWMQNEGIGRSNEM